MTSPETRYVTVGDADIAYQAVGQGPGDLLFCFPLGGHVDLYWQIPQGAEFLNRLASFRRLVVFDRRGSGASDALPLSAVPTWETLAEDMAAVLDAAGSQQADVMAANDTGPIAVLFAAMHPERVRSLVLINTAARYLQDDDYPIGVSPADLEALLDFLTTSWGTSEFAGIANSAHAHDAHFTASVARMNRAAATPRTAAAQFRYFLGSLDVRKFLPHVQAPTLVLQVKDSPVSPLAHGRYLADHIPGASFIELPGADLTPAFGAETVSDIAEFLTGHRPAVDVDRILTTVLFTDIVASTERAARLGDSEWRRLLDAHDRTVRDQLRVFRGREINTTGDGFYVSFEGPARAIRCARAIVESVRPLGIEVRAGMHTGECEVRGDDLAGLAVHIAARIGSLASPSEVLVSSTVEDLVVGSGIRFVDRGSHDLKGVPGSWRLTAVVD